ncbi:globin domain-containing protein [Nocardiopsis sp. NPDC050513]|uniref:globin domain-containing protein n=1 Tax=Nocardiopsis sp. NPDC050513 TaxID=3364338 RepID=UPI0037B7D881
MLSTESAAVIRATIPVVAGALDEISSRFYASMLGDRPELLDGLFNRGNQATGEQRRALAGSIAAFATALLERPDERPDALLSRIAHKHVSVGVTDDQYVIVHKYLFAAIGEVLGDAASSETVAAWDEVYWLMAGALTALEARLYARRGLDGGDVWRVWRVVERRELTRDAVSLTLEPGDDGPAPGFRPGQYVSVRLRMPDGVRQARQYTLTGAEGRRRGITVKRARAGRAPEGEVSALVHETVRVGDTLEVSAPAGDVALSDDARPVVLASAGIGCTPMLAMLRHIAEHHPDRRVLVLHADRSADDHAHREETAALAGRIAGADLLTWYESGERDRSGRMDLSGVDLPEDCEVYLCGPLPFMRDVRAQVLAAGVPARSVHYEVFGPDLWLGVD